MSVGETYMAIKSNPMSFFPFSCSIYWEGGKEIVYFLVNKEDNLSQGLANVFVFLFRIYDS